MKESLALAAALLAAPSVPASAQVRQSLSGPTLNLFMSCEGGGDVFRFYRDPFVVLEYGIGREGPEFMAAYAVGASRYLTGAPGALASKTEFTGPAFKLEAPFDVAELPKLGGSKVQASLTVRGSSRVVHCDVR